MGNAFLTSVFGVHTKIYGMNNSQRLLMGDKLQETPISLHQIKLPLQFSQDLP